jgi:hypothetical protein
MENGDFWSTDMNSFNHYAYGSVADWVYEKAAGITPLEDYPGFGKVLIKPYPDDRMEWLEAAIDTRNGKISSKWTHTEDGIRYDIETAVPATVEIGVMKVLGCLVKDIKRQFLLEAGLIGLAGGVVGILISYILSYLINKYGAGIMGAIVGTGTEGKLSVIPFWLPFAAVAFGMLVGLLSGYFPARRATKIRAIEAMKTEG